MVFPFTFLALALDTSSMHSFLMNSRTSSSFVNRMPQLASTPIDFRCCAEISVSVQVFGGGGGVQCYPIGLQWTIIDTSGIAPQHISCLLAKLGGQLFPSVLQNIAAHCNAYTTTYVSQSQDSPPPSPITRNTFQRFEFAG